MSEANAASREETGDNGPSTHQVRLPGFISLGNEGAAGLGDLVRRVTSHVGIRPCGACERRAAALNRWMVFKDRRGA